MYNIYKTYLQSIISEAEDDDIDLNDLNDIEDSENNKPSENNDTDTNILYTKNIQHLIYSIHNPSHNRCQLANDRDSALRC